MDILDCLQSTAAFIGNRDKNFLSPKSNLCKKAIINLKNEDSIAGNNSGSYMTSSGLVVTRACLTYIGTKLDKLVPVLVIAGMPEEFEYFGIDSKYRYTFMPDIDVVFIQLANNVSIYDEKNALILQFLGRLGY